MEQEILKIEKCGDLFTNDIDKCKCTFGKYSARARERKILRVHK